MNKNKPFTIHLIEFFIIALIFTWMGVVIKGCYDNNVVVGKNAATIEQVYQTCLDEIPDNSALTTYEEYEESVNEYNNMVKNCERIYKELKNEEK